MEHQPNDWSRTSQLVADALEVPPGERGAWLDTACGGDAALRREVDSLVSASDDAGAFLAGSALESPEAAAVVAAMTRQSRNSSKGGRGPI